MELEDEVNIMLADTIKSYDFTDDISSYLNPFMASVDAKLALLTDTLNLKVGELASSTLGADNALSSQIMAANNLISILNQESSTTVSNLAVASAKLEWLNTLVLANDARLTTLELFASSSIADLQSAIINLSVSASSTLRVADDSLMADTLVVTEAADFVGTITVRGEANFEAKVTFKKPVVLSADSAGTAMIKAGEKFVEVKFSESYEAEPKIVANLNNDDENIFIIYKIASKTKDGFKIVLAEPVDQNLNFDWLAFAATPEEATSTEALPAEPVAEVISEEPISNPDPVSAEDTPVDEPAVESPEASVPPVEETDVSIDTAVENSVEETPAEAAADLPAVLPPETPSAPEVVAAN
jgi:hypothetical protein